jgi:hypothetical protein
MTLLAEPASSLTTRQLRRFVRSPLLGGVDPYGSRHTYRPLRSVQLQPGPDVDPFIQWLARKVEAELNRLVRLEEGWDGRRAREVTDEAVVSSVEALFALVGDHTWPAPQFFPLPDGGLQFEWHMGGAAVEVEVDSEGEAHALAESPDGSVLFEGVIWPQRDAALADFQRSVTPLFLAVMASR